MKFPSELPANKDKVPIFPPQTFQLIRLDSDCSIYLLLRIFFGLLFQGFISYSLHAVNLCSICYVHFRLRVVALSDIAIIILGVHHFIYGYMPNKIYWLKKPYNYYGRWCSGYIQRATISPLFSIKTKNSVCCLA